MARKDGQIIAQGDHTWLIRVYLGRDHETNERGYHNRTIHRRIREVPVFDEHSSPFTGSLSPLSGLPKITVSR